jgi:hypothetical protein
VIVIGAGPHLFPPRFDSTPKFSIFAQIFLFLLVFPHQVCETCNNDHNRSYPYYILAALATLNASTFFGKNPQ